MFIITKLFAHFFYIFLQTNQFPFKIGGFHAKFLFIKISYKYFAGKGGYAAIPHPDIPARRNKMS